MGKSRTIVFSNNQVPTITMFMSLLGFEGFRVFHQRFNSLSPTVSHRVDMESCQHVGLTMCRHGQTHELTLFAAVGTH